MSVSTTSTQLPTASDPANAEWLKTLPGFDRVAKKNLDQSDFLKILTTQLSHQDPMNPQDDTNSIAQMATFSSVQSMSDLMANLKSFMTQQTWGQAQGYLGKWVLIQDASSNSTTMGTVTSVMQDKDGKPQVMVNGTIYDAGNIVQIRESAPGATDTTGTSPTPGGDNASTPATGG